MGRIIVVSADGHASPTVLAVRRYIDPAYRIYLDDLIREDVAYIGTRAMPARPPRLTLPVFDDRALVRSGGELGAADPDIRLEQMDAEGIAAEIVHVGTQVSQMPFFGVTNGVWPADVRAVGSRAYHRWLADFMAGCDGRLFGVADPGPCTDMDDTLRELEWVAEHGFVSVGVPGSTADPSLPALKDRFFEPFWSACADLGLVLSVHAGWGGSQTPVKEWRSAHDIGDGETTGGHDFNKLSEMMQVMGSPIRLGLQQPRRPMWQLMAGGVFDRHPRLKMALTEIRADWVPATLAHLDHRFDELHVPCERTPTKYFIEHCLVVPSSPHRAEVDMRDEIGVNRFGFGQDFPHWEGLWPNTLDWLRHAFGGVDETDLRAILGGNAIRFYGLPEAKLAGVAARIGPDAADILGDHPVSEELLQHFQRRAGYLRPADPVFVNEIDDMLEPDLAGLGIAAP